MGNVYFLYLEAKVKEREKERWKCINGYFKYIPYGKTEEKMELSHLYVSGSRSYFGETYDMLREIGNLTPFTELSKEVQEEHPSLKFKYNVFEGTDSDEIESYVTVPVSVLKEKTPEGYEYHGVYHKNRIAAYESGETDDLWEEEEIDFSKMDPLEKQCYAYKEWDSDYGWQKHFKELVKLIENVTDQYATDTWDFDAHEMRVVAFCL